MADSAEGQATATTQETTQQATSPATSPVTSPAAQESTTPPQQPAKTIVEKPAKVTFTDDDIRGSKLFKSQAKAHSAIKQELDELKQSLIDKKAAEEQKALEAKGEYDKILAQKEQSLKDLKKSSEAELTAKVAAYEKKILNMKLENELIRAGASNQIFIGGAINSYEGDVDGIAEFVKQLEEDENHKEFFGKQVEDPKGKPLPHGQHVKSAGSKSIEDGLADGDESAITAFLDKSLGISR